MELDAELVHEGIVFGKLYFQGIGGGGNVKFAAYIVEVSSPDCLQYVNAAAVNNVGYEQHLVVKDGNKTRVTLTETLRFTPKVNKTLLNKAATRLASHCFKAMTEG